MKSFVMGVVAAVVIAAVGALLLDDLVQRPVSAAFSTEAARVNDG